MSTEQDPITKLPKLKSSRDYIHWRLVVHAYIRRTDFELLGFTEEPENASTAVRKKWLEAMIKAKSAIFLSLGSGALAQISDIIDDDDRTAKELWDVLSKLYTTSNAQVVINLENELESLRFKENESWKDHMDKFHELLGKLASYDSPVKEEEKASKLLRTLPESFAPLSMVAQTSELSLDKVFVAVEGELSRRLNKKQDEKPNGQNQGHAASKGRKGASSAVQEGFIDKKKKHVQCYICGKYGHYANECYHKHSHGEFTRQDYHRPRGRGCGRGRFPSRGRGRGGYFRGSGYGRGMRGVHSHAYGYQQYPPYGNPLPDSMPPTQKKWSRP